MTGTEKTDIETMDIAGMDTGSKTAETAFAATNPNHNKAEMILSHSLRVQSRRSMPLQLRVYFSFEAPHV